jgi:cobalamin-dependent methionine synthase I
MIEMTDRVDVDCVALSGGCFQNRALTEACVSRFVLPVQSIPIFVVRASLTRLPYARKILHTPLVRVQAGNSRSRTRILAAFLIVRATASHLIAPILRRPVAATRALPAHTQTRQVRRLACTESD